MVWNHKTTASTTVMGSIKENISPGHLDNSEACKWFGGKSDLVSTTVVPH